MDLKTYRGSSMAEALAEVKKDLGKDAVILHARTTKTGGVLGFGGTPLVEITAAPADAAGRTPRRTDTRIADRAERRIEAGENEAFSTADWKRESDPALTSLARAKTDTSVSAAPLDSLAAAADHSRFARGPLTSQRFPRVPGPRQRPSPRPSPSPSCDPSASRAAWLPPALRRPRVPHA
ncbi:MAG: hypothetical protein SFY96_08775 [Planctomycetota bacterium]|nr:hypothetical protein [Planctomycetota bacterium]